jgi:hypothetical protein
MTVHAEQGIPAARGRGPKGSRDIEVRTRPVLLVGRPVIGRRPVLPGHGPVPVDVRQVVVSLLRHTAIRHARRGRRVVVRHAAEPFPQLIEQLTGRPGAVPIGALRGPPGPAQRIV